MDTFKKLSSNEDIDQIICEAEKQFEKIPPDTYVQDQIFGFRFAMTAGKIGMIVMENWGLFKDFFSEQICLEVEEVVELFGNENS